MTDLTNRHRFTLTRSWMGTGGRICWVMLNPSTADEQIDDPTIRKCIGFSKRWGFSGLIVVNLFAFRATDPHRLHALISNGHTDYAIGNYGRPGGNNEAIAEAARESDLVVVAWGANAARYQDRVREVLGMLNCTHCIGLTKAGHPLHPCMAAYTDAPRNFTTELMGLFPSS